MNALTATSSRRRKAITRGLIFAAIAALFALLPNVARADSNTTYDISGTLSNGSSFSGVLDFDTNSSGVTTLVNTTFTIGGVAFTCNGASSNNCIVENIGSLQYFTALNGSSLVLLNWNAINFPNTVPSFTFTGGYCMSCGAGGTGTLMVTGGGGVPAPEPSTTLLLVAGLFALGFLAHTRSASASKA
jgi:hypothetical protein